MYKLRELKNYPQYFLASKQVAFIFFIRYGKNTTEIIPSGLSPLVLMDSGLHPATLNSAVGICCFWPHDSENGINDSSSGHSILNLNSKISFSECQEFTYYLPTLTQKSMRASMPKEDPQSSPMKCFGYCWLADVHDVTTILNHIKKKNSSVNRNQWTHMQLSHTEFLLQIHR